VSAFKLFLSLCAAGGGGGGRGGGGGGGGSFGCYFLSATSRGVRTQSVSIQIKVAGIKMMNAAEPSSHLAPPPFTMHRSTRHFFCN